MITRTTIDQVYETARVEEVIGDFVVLKKSGSNFKGLSPFSDERSPSFMVSPAKQLWKDFSSGKGGSVISFLMEHEHFSYPEAIKYLANNFEIVENGDHVLCAISGKVIKLEELTYWNVELQEAYFSYKEAFLKKELLNNK